MDSAVRVLVPVTRLGAPPRGQRALGPHPDCVASGVVRAPQAERVGAVACSHSFPLLCAHSEPLIPQTAGYTTIPHGAVTPGLHAVTLAMCLFQGELPLGQTLPIPITPRAQGSGCRQPWVTRPCSGARGSSYDPSPFLEGQPPSSCHGVGGSSCCRSRKHRVASLRAQSERMPFWSVS